MANRYKIEHHPQRKLIERDILNGVPDNVIADNYGHMSRQGVARYKRERMPEIMRHADLQTTEGIIRRINEYLDDVDELYKSVKEYLEDPNNPGKMDFTPHADEIYMTYEDIDEATGKKFRKKDTIQAVLDRCEPQALKLSLGIQDPRVTMLKTAEVLNKQLELMSRVKGLINEQTVVNVNQDISTVSEVIAIARRSLRPYPEALEAFVTALMEGTDEEQD